MEYKMYVRSFGEGNASMKMLLGGKGANLAEMVRLGLPIPPGFTITTEACIDYFKVGFSEVLREQIRKHVRLLEVTTGRRFGDLENPLLVSVRSGAAVSMPGMMDTILNLGINDQTIKGLIKDTQDERFVYDCYRRFIQMYSNVVFGIKHERFEETLNAVKKKWGVTLDSEMNMKAVKDAVTEYKKTLRTETGKVFPQNPWENLFTSVEAVFKSWNNRRAITYRKLHNVPNEWGTAVNVQAMVFGNMGDTSGSGVAFTRNPATGKKHLYGEYLLNAQGEDIVAGIRTPKSINNLRNDLPNVYEDLVTVCDILENHHKDLQDIEFTIEKGKLFILQTRTGKRTVQAAVKIAVDLAEQGLISKEEALLRIHPPDLVKVYHQTIDPKTKVKVLATGIPASPGVASGLVVFNPDDAERLGKEGKKVILVRPETTPEDVHGLASAQGCLTSRGGTSSHAAIVARAMGKPCIVGCDAVHLGSKQKYFEVKGHVVEEGDIITIDGTLGRVIVGEAPIIEPKLGIEVKKLLSWADEVRTLRIMANADTPKSAQKAREFGAEGIGLCRTERMFNAQDRLPIVQEMIMARSDKERKNALDRLIPFQKDDFKEIFRIMKGLPVIIRLLDPPLHEFLPSFEKLLLDVTVRRLKNDDNEDLEKKEEILKVVSVLREANPMLGFRACRLGIVYPEIYDMQVRAILESATEIMKEGYDVKLKIMIPGVGHKEEIEYIISNINRVVSEVEQGTDVKLDYEVGTMIELPRACLTADEIAEHVDFFSFGTNDLTQTTLGWSRDDAEDKFVPEYIERQVLRNNPFSTIDTKGVGKLMSICVDLGRKTKKELEIGICGEHGGDYESIILSHQLGLDYVSCSPFRVPMARLATAHAKLKEKM